jgi:hypothetical protein
MTNHALNSLNLVIAIFVTGLFTACGGGSSGDSPSQSITPPQSSSSSSSAITVSSIHSVASSSIASRQKIALDEALFFNEPGLWLAYTEIDARVRFKVAEDDPQTMRETRLRETSIDTYIFTRELGGIEVGPCVRTPDIFRDFGLEPITPVGSELYCLPEQSFFHEPDNSYTMEYYCDNQRVMKTRMHRLSSKAQLQDFGLTLAGVPAQQPSCVHWNISHFETWSLDSAGKEIAMLGKSAMLQWLLFRWGEGKSSRFIQLTRAKPFEVGVYDLKQVGDSAQSWMDQVTASVTPVNAGLPYVPGVHLGNVHGGELRIDSFSPLSVNGSFEMKGEVPKESSLSGSFAFDFGQYFSE